MSDDYIDYSCSTHMERLARDIETILIHWHVNASSDRHIKGNSPILRRQKILFHLHYCDLELELTLHDGPEATDSSEQDHAVLPYSIRRRNLESNFCNLSNLFGIGQYITLLPVNSQVLEASDIPLNPSYKKLVQDLGPDKNSILTHWLQTALNYAVSFCQCNIPAFGFWGPYNGSDHEVSASVNGQLVADDTSHSFTCTKLTVTGKRNRPNWAELGVHFLKITREHYCRLDFARHTFLWKKPPRRTSILWQALGYRDDHWRTPFVAQVDDETYQGYKRNCEIVALRALERAWGASDRAPSWGPPEDPIDKMMLDLEYSKAPLLTLQDKEYSSEWLEATEYSIFHSPSVSKLSVLYDSNAANLTQTSTQRCVLAALIRTATLPKETTMATMVSKSWPDGNRVAAVLARKANVDGVTKSLVAAMDWTERELLEEYRAKDIVSAVVQEIIEFPDAPSTVGTSNDPILHSAPPGRLLSLLFLQMARLRSPSSMAILWMTFNQELRRRWENHENLPNLVHVPGLDRENKTNMAQISTEPDPDETYCLIGQKLQVFNIGLETQISMEFREFEQQEKRRRLDYSSQDESFNDAPSSEIKASTLSLMNGALVDGLPAFDDDGNAADDSQTAVSQDEFYDANDAGNIINRKGARCPVMGGILIQTGDQLYAPYLQRPYPLTEDVIQERKLMLQRQSGGKSLSTIQSRLEIAQRYQRPKLLSDMKSFKAANPNCTFLDFVGWYGNPTDPLAEFADETHEIVRGNSARDVKVEKRDKAAEAIQVLEMTRDFWTQNWEAADATPANLQEPLFDAESTVEMALDYLDNLHPAILLCQVLAVNLSMAYFTLSASAGETVNILPVSVALTRLREKVDTAVQLLHADASQNNDSPKTVDVMASIDSIHAASKACEALMAAEVIVARASSLLYKLPEQYKLIESILKLPDGKAIHLEQKEGRVAFLETVHKQQASILSHETVQPAIREYLFRNNNDDLPCQLVVKFSDEGIHVLGKDTIGTVVALTRSSMEG